MNRKAFTLVELVVMVAILVVMSTIWIISLTDYLSWVRDSNRITQISNMRDWIALKINAWLLLTPERAVEIQNNWIPKSFQWVFWSSLIEKIWYSMDWLDPKDKQYFTYTLSADWKYFQLVALLENEESYLWVWYENILIKDNNLRIPYIVWSKEIWVFFNDLVIPVQDYSTSPLNITDSSTDTYNVILRNDRIVTSSWWTLFSEMNNVVANYWDNIYWCASQTYNYANYHIWNPVISNTPRQNLNSNAPCYFSCKVWYTWNWTNCEPGATNITSVCPSPVANALPNIATSISRNWDSSIWDYIPSLDLIYNVTPSSSECRFKCRDNYTWDWTSCNPSRQTLACSWKPDLNSSWNTISQVEQVWNWTSWSPTNIGIHNTISSDSECRFKCNINFTYESWSNTCSADTRNENCVWQISNSTLYNLNITQTWNWTSWLPNLNSSYSSTDVPWECRYYCNLNYTYNSWTSTCDANTQNIICNWNPAHSTFHNASITQTWNWSSWGPTPTPIRSTSPLSNQCSFDCNSFYTWNWSSCELATRPMNCNAKPANSSWNTVSSITQTYDFWIWDWVPSITPLHNLSPSNLECRFICNTNYTYNSWTNTCEPNTQLVNCIWNPSNSYFHNANITQTWNWSNWLPNSTSSYSLTPIANECRYTCSSNYSWNGSSCVPSTQTASCSSKPANSSWNTVSSITQTWNGSTWLPEPTTVYDTNSSLDQCNFICSNSYTWNSALCFSDISFNWEVRAIKVLSDWKILVWWWFSTVWWVTRYRLVRLNNDWTLDTSFNANIASNASTIYDIELQTDGKILIWWTFTSVWWQPRNRIARLNSDWTLDTWFNPNSSWTVFSLELQTDGKILVWWAFTSIWWQSRTNIARLNTNWTADTSFIQTNTASTVYDVKLQTDWKILIWWAFTSVWWQTRNRIARLNSDWTLDTWFNPNSWNSVWVIKLQTDWKILVWWDFTSIAWTSRSRVARLNSTWTIDLSFWQTSASSTVYDIEIQSDWKIVIWWNFTTLLSNTRNWMARLNSNWTLDTLFNPNVITRIYSIDMDSLWNFILWGTFTSVSWISKNRFSIFKE